MQFARTNKFLKLFLGPSPVYISQVFQTNGHSVYTLMKPIVPTAVF